MKNFSIKLINIKILIYMSIFFIIFSCKTNINNSIAITHSVIRTEGYDTNKYIYTTDIENNKLKINKFIIENINKSLCQKRKSYFIRKIFLQPLIVECRLEDDGTKRIITNGNWSYILERHQRVIGSNGRQLILNDLSLINNKTGRIFKEIKKLVNYNVAAKSSNGRYFIIDNNTVSEVSVNGSESRIVRLPSKILTTIVVSKMISNNSGDHLFLIAKNSSRGQDQLLVYVIDVRNKSIAYKKKLEDHCICNNEDIQFQSNRDSSVLIIYRDLNKQAVNSYWLKFRK